MREDLPEDDTWSELSAIVLGFVGAFFILIFLIQVVWKTLVDWMSGAQND